MATRGRAPRRPTLSLKPPMQESPGRYFLGLPAWAFPGWTGRYFPAPTRDASTLGYYAQVFNTVEGNTTFYRIPDEHTVSRWREAVAGTPFRFSFKIPRAITHERTLDRELVQQFMAVLEPLGDHLGPFLVQLPASLGPENLGALKSLFEALPSSHRYCLELRHLEFFETPELIEPLLARYNAGRVMFDSRPIYQGDSQHPEVLAARHKKPDVPLLDTVYNGLAYARVVLHPDSQHNEPYVEEWLARTQAYLEAGHTVYFMMHCPNNLHCPAFAEQFHLALRQRAGDEVWPFPAWPLPQQDSLF